MPVADDGVLRDAEHLAVQEAVAGEIEGVDLDLGFLPGVDKADVAVRHHGLDFQPAVARHDHQQGLRRRDNAADRVDRELLHHAVDGSGQQLKPGLLLGLDQVLGEPVRLLLGLGEFVGERVPIFGHRLAARLANRGHGRLRFVQMALLNAEFLLLLDQQLEDLEIGELRAQLLVHERLADVDALLDDRNHRLELMDGGRGRGLLGFLLRLLAGERGDLGAVLGHLVEQEAGAGC